MKHWIQRALCIYSYYVVLYLQTIYSVLYIQIHVYSVLYTHKVRADTVQAAGSEAVAAAGELADMSRTPDGRAEVLALLNAHRGECGAIHAEQGFKQLCDTHTHTHRVIATLHMIVRSSKDTLHTVDSTT